jgi:nucleotide-binding universal stress UspA family protein
MTKSRVITVGIDGSANSAQALSWAAREASKRGCGLRAIHTYSIPYTGGEFGAGAIYPAVHLEELNSAQVASVNEQLAGIVSAYPDLRIETVVEPGWATREIVERSGDAELTVLGSRGVSSFAAMVLGSVAHGVAHRSMVPVVLVPDVPVSGAIGRIVVGTDGSPSADAALDWAVTEAELWGAELSVLHAWEYPYVGPRSTVVEPVELMELDATRLLTDTVRALRSRHPETTVSIHAEVVRATATTALVEAAGASDLIVVGARGRSAIRSVLLGSTSASTLHRAVGPVAIVHAVIRELPR